MEDLLEGQLTKRGNAASGGPLSMRDMTANTYMISKFAVNFMYAFISLRETYQTSGGADFCEDARMTDCEASILAT